MALSQSHYRFGVASGTESTHGWLDGEDREVFRLPGAAGQFLLRLCVQETAGVQTNNVALEWQYRHNGGDWLPVTTSSAVVRTGSTAVFANGAHCTKRLSGTGTFEASGAGCTHDGTSGGNANDIAASGNSETLIGLQILGGDTAVGDLIEFRVTRGGSTLLDEYAVIPAVRVAVNILDVESRDTSAHTSLSAAVARISRAIVSAQCVGMSQADLEDPALSMEMSVMGSVIPGSTDPADFTTLIEGPFGWTGGTLGKNGVYNPPGFSFIKDMPQDIRRVLATFQPSRTTTFGAQACVVDLE